MGSFSSTGILLIWLHLQTSFASVIIQRCPLSATENTQNYHIICSGFDRNVKIEWKVDFGDGYGEINHGECPGINSCQSRYPLERDITRPTMDTSHMIINNVTRLYSKAIFKCLISNSEDANCLMDVIYGAEVSECKVQIIKGELWTINGSCYIQKGFSSRNNYSCELLQRENSGSSTTLGKKTFNPSLNNENPPYASGSCSFTGLGFPTNSANYNYTFNIIPGNINIQAGVIIVEKPTIKPVVACPPIVKENSTLTCSCNSSNLGKPKGRLAFYRGNSLLVGGNYGDAMLNFSKRTLFRNESESSYRCVLDWATASNEDVYTQFYIIIAYGPDTVSLTGPDVFDIDPRNNVTLTLMCLPSEAKPNVSILWSERCASAIGKTCIMTPTIQDDDVMITCNVTNMYAEVTKVTTRKLVVNYPPSTPPLIHGYSNGEILYAEDSLSMTCTVKGGKPVNETNIMFLCPGKRIDASDIRGVTEVNSTLTFDPLEADDHNKTCTCSAQWKNTNFYTMQTGIKLTVYSPPSDPVVTSSSSEYPFIAGITVNASLMCVSSNTGQPPTTYTWTSAEDGVPSTDGLGRGKLTFYSFRPEHHNRTITCLATNAFTTAKQRVVTGIFYLNVYYEPIITILLSEIGNECTQTDILQTCSVFENQPTRLRCSASSNPPPESVSWSNKFGMQSNIITIDIQRTNRTLDNVIFTCKASTRVLDNRGLALVGEKNITIIVKYSPDEIIMTINSNSSIFTANENEIVVIECIANGRPTPKLDLYHHEKRVGGEDGGKIISTDYFTRMYYILGNASCKHNGLYKCIAHNTVGSSMNTTARLQVICKPQLFDSNQISSDHIPSVNYNGHPATLYFSVIAFPSINMCNIISLDSNLSTSSIIVAETFFHLECVPLSTDSIFNCSITVDGITNSQKGNYTAIVSNSVGSYSYRFEVTVNGDGSPGPNIGVIVGVVGGFFAALLIAVTLFFVTSYIRRRKHPETTESTAMHDSDRTIVENILVEDKRSRRPVQKYTDVDTNSVGNENGDTVSSLSYPALKPKPTIIFASDTGKDAYAKVNKPIITATTQKIKPTKTVVSKRGKDSYTTVNKTKVKESNNPRTTLTDPCDTVPKKGDGTSSSKECVEYAKVDKIRKNDGKLSKPWKFAFNKLPGDKSEDVKSAKINKKKNPKTDKIQLVENNTPLSMKPQRDAVYENVVLESNMQYENKMKAARVDDSDRDVNQDGLVYSKIQFSKEQQQKATECAPDHISTPYAIVDFTKSGFPVQVPDKSD